MNKNNQKCQITQCKEKLQCLKKKTSQNTQHENLKNQEVIGI